MARFPSPGKAWSAIRRRARGGAYLAQDVGYAAGRIPRALARGAGTSWRRLSGSTRKRLAAAVGSALLALLVIVVAVPALPCSFPGGDRCAPPDDAAELVPADALAYAHVNVDPDTDQVKDLAATARRFPLISEQLLGRLLVQIPGAEGGAADFEREVEPWFGGEAAVALLPAGRAASQVEMLEVDDTDAARAYADGIAAGTPDTRKHRGVEVAVDRRGLAAAITNGFLVLGTAAGVKAVIDAATGGADTRSLADDPEVEAVRDRLPDERFADFYVSPDGAALLLADERGPLAPLEPFVDAGATTGAAAAIAAGQDELELSVRSSLDAEEAEASPGFFAAFPEFDPELPGRLDPATLAYLGFGDPQATVQALYEQASTEAPGVAAGITDLVERLRDLGQVDLQRDLLPALRGEAALTLQSGARENEDGSDDGATGSASLSGIPYVQFVAGDVQERDARDALARLQAPIAEALEGSEQQAPVFAHRSVGGVDVQSLRVSPTVELTYAVFDSSLVIATAPQGVEQIAAGEGGLASTDTFEQATAGLAESPSLFAYLNLASLLRLAEANGLADDPAYATFAGELRKLEAVAVEVESAPESLDTDARLVIAARDQSADSTTTKAEPTPPGD